MTSQKKKNKERRKRKNEKSVANGDTESIAANSNDVLTFLKAVAVKVPMLETLLIQLHAYKRAWDCLHK